MSADDPELTPTPGMFGVPAAGTITQTQGPAVGLSVTGDTGDTGAGPSQLGRAVGAGAQSFGKGMQGAAARPPPNVNAGVTGAPPPQRDSFDVIFGHGVGGTATAPPAMAPIAPMVATSDRRAKVDVRDGTAAVRRFLDALQHAKV